MYLCWITNKSKMKMDTDKLKNYSFLERKVSELQGDIDYFLELNREELNGIEVHVKAMRGHVLVDFEPRVVTIKSKI